VTQTAVAVHKASMRDIPNLLALINSYAANGIMLPRTEFEMLETSGISRLPMTAICSRLRSFAFLYSGHGRSSLPRSPARTETAGNRPDSGRGARS
jgi:hypothetical protein